MLPVAAAVAGGAYLVAIYLQEQWLKLIIKPLPLIFLIIWVADAAPERGWWGWFILAGLIASVVGDMLLLLPPRWFKYGLGAFLVGHLFYIAALTLRGAYDHLHLVPVVSLMAFGIAIVQLTGPGVIAQGGRGLMFGVALYTGVISVMLFGAVNYGRVNPLAGALLFYISDGILALNRFWRRFKGADYAVMCTYYAAQFFFARSVAG